MFRPVYEIDTPENVRFTFERAGLASRALAWAIDVAFMLCLIQLGAAVLSPFELLLGQATGALWFVLLFLVQWWYATLCEWRFAGRTVGKRLLGLAALDEKGLRLSFYQATIRNLLRIVDFLPGLYLVGGITSLLDRHGRRLGDLAASTVVIRERRDRWESRALAEAQRDLLHYPAVVEASRRLSPAERDAVLSLCAERDRLELSMRLELFDRLARHLEQRFALVRPAHLTSEKLVLYVGAALTGTGAAKGASQARRARRRNAQES